MSSTSSDLWNNLTASLFANIDDAFVAEFRKPGGANSRLAAWDPFDRTMRYFRFMLFNACERQPDRFFDLYASLGDTLIGAPVTVKVRGLDINIDHLFSVEEFMFVDRAIGASNVRSVVEIGAGFGRTCQAFLALAPSVERYTIVDLPNVLGLSRRVLQKVAPEKFDRITFIDATDRDAWQGLEADLAINIDSFQEMSPSTIDGYREGILRHARHVYIKNPIGKYAPESIGIEVNDPAKFHDVFKLGYCRTVVDIFDDASLVAARKAYLEAYRPAADWRTLADEPLDMFRYLHHVLYGAP
jgi:putative sugar O-methyltransferase